MRSVASFKTILTPLALVALASCTNSSTRIHLEQPITLECSGKSNALTAAPVPKTRDEMGKLLSYENKRIEMLYEEVGQGDPMALVELGLRHATGNGLENSPEQAYNFFRRAAEQGSPVGKYFLGSAYSNGLGVPTDDARAVSIWKESAAMGHPLSQFWLGFFVANGRGGQNTDWCAAIPLFEAAAAEDITDAAYMLGLAYDMGHTGPSDFQTAAKWYRRSFEKQLNQKSQYNLRLLIESGAVEWQEGDPGEPPTKR
jgi:TPR repeat protein